MRYWLFTLLLVSFVAQGQQVAKTWVTPDGWTAGVLIYTPPGIDTMSAGHKPGVIIYSHGNGEAVGYNSGTAISAANGLLVNEIPKLLTNTTQFRFQENGNGAWRSFVVISIARNTNESPFQASASNQYIDWSLKYMRDSLASKVDTFRIYHVGISGGGATGWKYPAVDQAHAEKFAAEVQVCPTTEFVTWCNIAAGNLPIWAFHALNDGTTPASSTIGAIAAINACGTSPAPILDTPAMGGHSIWPTYLDTNYVSPHNGLNVYEWMLKYTRDSSLLPTYPVGLKMDVVPADVFDVTGAGKRTDRLFDGDTSIASNVFQDQINEYILTQTDGQIIWIGLDSFVTNPRCAAFKSGYPGGGGTISFQFFYDWSDTTRHSDVFTATLADATWSWADSGTSRAYEDSSRLVRIRIPTANVDKLTEAQIWAHPVGPAPSLFPSFVASPPDPGKYFQGTNKVQVDTIMDDCVWSIRPNLNTDYVDTATVGTIDGKNIVFNKFSDQSIELTWLPTYRQGRKQHMYLANHRTKYSYPDSTDFSKDIPLSTDSTNLTNWTACRNTYYALAAKLGHNTSVVTTGYSVASSTPGWALGLAEKMEIGNEYKGVWKGNRGFHRPLVGLTLVKAGYNGVKAADPNMAVIMGALTGIDTMYAKGMYMENLIKYQTKIAPWDEMAVNEYATNAGGQHEGGSIGISPESFQFYLKSIGFNIMRDKYYPGVPTLCTEFGWDVNTGSNYVVKDIAGQTRQETKAFWQLRSFEIAAAAKWSGMYHYTHKDGGGGDFSTTGAVYDTLLLDPGNTLPSYLWQFMTAGQLTSGGWVTLPRVLYWHMVMRARIIPSYNAWPVVIQNGDSTGIWILKYTHKTRVDSVMYSIWYGTSNNSTSSNYSVSIPFVVGAKISHGIVGDKDGTITSLTFGTGSVIVPTVDESVQYIQAKIIAIRQYFRGSLRNKFIQSP